MTIEDNIKIRRATDDVFELLSEFIKETVDSDHMRAVWLRVGEMVDSATQVDRTPQATPDAMSDDEKKRFERTEVPFGKHSGKQVKDVPLSYLEWIDGDEFRTDLRRYLKHPDVWREQE